MPTEFCPGEPDSWTWPDAYDIEEGENVNRYFLEMREGSGRFPVGVPQGYETLEEAARASKKRVADVLPCHHVHILKDVGYAFLKEDGGEAVSIYGCVPEEGSQDEESSVDPDEYPLF